MSDSRLVDATVLAAQELGLRETKVSAPDSAL